MDGFGHYLDSIGRWPLLTAAQEIELARLTRAGIETREAIGARKPTPREARIMRTGERSAEKMVLCNLRLVVNIARQYARHCGLHEIEDLVQYGSIGLKRAAEKFDHEKGYKFSTYAYWWIRQEIQRGIYRSDRFIQLPERCRLIWARIKKTAIALGHELGRAPTTKELIKAADIAEEEYDIIMRAMNSTASLNAITGEGTELMDLIGTESDGEVEERHDCTAMLACIATLPDEERELITKRYGLDDHHTHTFVELAKARGVSRETIRQRVGRIENRIRLRLTHQSA